MWQNLPRELLPEVFARLPLPLVKQLQQTPWPRFLRTSTFRELCAQIQPTSPTDFALILPRKDSSGNLLYNARVYNAMSKTWQTWRLGRKAFPATASDRSPTKSLMASGGGLVCFVFMEENPTAAVFHLEVVNPLTGCRRVLPLWHHFVSDYMENVELVMVQLVMDRAAGRYDVLLVLQQWWHGNYSNASPIAEVFDSSTGLWSNAKNHPFLGTVFGMDRFERPQAYNCATGVLDRLSSGGFLGNGCEMSSRFQDYALVGDRYFVMAAYVSDREGVWRYIMFESEAEMDGMAMQWTMAREPRIKSWSEQFFVESTLWYHLYAWRRFLMVVALEGQSVSWLYDLATGVRQELPELPDGEKFPKKKSESGIACELQWEAVP